MFKNKKSWLACMLVIVLVMVSTITVSAAVNNSFSWNDGYIYASGRLSIANGALSASMTADSEDGTYDVYTEMYGTGNIKDYLGGGIVPITGSGWGSCSFSSVFSECEDAECY